ncbi:HAAS domain-containing protein [Metabacillus sp. SLBN-84]
MAQLSMKSNRFLDDLRIYLFSSGKKEEEIKAIVEELRDHLVEAESDGKSIEAIVGRSPKEYMEQLNAEMSFDLAAWTKLIPLIAAGGLSYLGAGDLMEGPLQYSLWFIIGSLLSTLLFLGSVFWTFRFTASRQVSRMKEMLIFLLPITLSMLFIGGTMLGDAFIETPVIHLGNTGSAIVGVLLGVFLTGFSIWAKTLVLPVVLAALYIPAYLLSFTELPEMDQQIYGMIIGSILIGGFIIVEFTRLKKEA